MINGDSKSLQLLWLNLARQRRYSPYVTELDLKTFSRRVDNEGLHFLTSVLPQIGKALDSFHSTHSWTMPCDFSGRIVTGIGNSSVSLLGPVRIPHFLGNAIQSSLSGDPIAVDCVRQLSYVFYKLEQPYGDEKEKEFIANFIEIDRSLPYSIDYGDPFTDRLIRTMRYLLDDILFGCNPFEVVPRHGSGATSCRKQSWEKYHCFEYYPKLDDVYPYSDYFFFSPTHLADELDYLEFSETIDVPTARVCLVPKDSRGPRVISCEPAEMMYIQQGLMRKLYKHLELHNLTSGKVNFTDQSINRFFAKVGSENTNLATIDLSEASDRVLWSLVRKLFPIDWVTCFDACRSEQTLLPTGEVIKLNKFAPMGSGVCFPVEALVFWTCAVATEILYLNPKLDLSSPKSLQRELRRCKTSSDVYVYGDDIIVESFKYSTLIKGLTSIGFKVNTQKSYFQGHFRESCGGDYYRGYDVTPIKVRHVPGRSRTSIATDADLCNLFIHKFGYSDCASLISLIESENGYVFPRTLRELPATLRFDSCASNSVFFSVRFEKNFQRREHRILSLTSRSTRMQPANWRELLRLELSKSTSAVDPIGSLFPNKEREDPGWYTDPHSVNRKWVWAEL